MEETVPAVMMAVMVGVVSADVFARYLLDTPLRGAGELATLLFIWQVFLAGAGAARRRMHIAVDFMVQRLPSRLRTLTDLVVNLAVFGLLVTMVWLGGRFTLQSHFKQLQMLRIPYACVNWAVPVGCAMMAVHFLARVLRTVQGLRSAGFSLPAGPTAEKAPRDAAQQALTKERS